jgi:hypothetical protein
MVYNEDGVPPDITLGELLLMYFEWQSVFKVSDAAARAVYDLILLLLPSDNNAGSFALSKKLLANICKTRVVKIETCPNDPLLSSIANIPSWPTTSTPIVNAAQPVERIGT